jgi:hypothetical protein
MDSIFFNPPLDLSLQNIQNLKFFHPRPQERENIFLLEPFINTYALNKMTSPSPLPAGRQGQAGLPSPLGDCVAILKTEFLKKGRGGQVEKI